MKLKYSIWILAFTMLFALTACKEYVHVGPNWEALHEMEKPENTFPVRVTGDKKAKLGEDLKFSVQSAQTGKLWVVQVDPEDNLSVLFPNEADQKNEIIANTALTIPPKGAAWSIVADEPIGESVVAFVVTTGDTDLKGVLNQEKGMAKAIRIVAASPSWGLAKRVIEIKK